jgi:hypothetical protein
MGWVVNTTSQPLYPRKRHGTHCIGGCVDPRAGLDRCGKISLPPGFDHRTVQPVASRYTDLAIPAQLASNTRFPLSILDWVSDGGSFVTFKFLTAPMQKIQVFWGAPLCRYASSHRRFEGTTVFKKLLANRLLIQPQIRKPCIFIVCSGPQCLPQQGIGL